MSHPPTLAVAIAALFAVVTLANTCVSAWQPHPMQTASFTSSR
jgi:hypothetical protein